MSIEFRSRLQDLAARVRKQREHIHTEEATKHAFIMPFISILGYDVSNPLEVTPELCADVGIKKREKVDYAILQDGKPIIIFECKHHEADLSKMHASQLSRYFHVTSARLAVLTNGKTYWFYTDCEAANKMDSKPFFVFNLLDFRDQDDEFLQQFAKSSFDLEHILTSATELRLRYTQEILRLLSEQMQVPSEDFVKFFASQVYREQMTQSAIAQFTPMVQRACRQFISDQVTDGLKSALIEKPEPEAPVEATPSPAASRDDDIVISVRQKEQGIIETTEEEKQGYRIIRSLLKDVLDPKRIVMHNVKSYSIILLDDNSHKQLALLWFKGNPKYVSLFDTTDGQKVPIRSVDDLQGFADRLQATVRRYTQK